MSEINLLAEVTAFLRQPHGQFIAGQREAGRGAPFAVINPATGQAIAEVTAADSDQADRAMESARQAFSQWREMPTLADTLAEHREALAQLESLCSGKTITLARMNASPYGLAASVWSDNIRQALRYSEAIEAGIVWVNMHTFLDPAVPFGGMKGSGIGREFGSAFIDDYTELKSVMVRY